MNDEVRAVLIDLIDEADSGAWHSSQDCRVEERDQECELCLALAAARALIERYKVNQ